jgi:anti-sigma B factor antagonist
VDKETGERRAGANALEVSVERSGEGVLLRLAGELDLGSAPRLEGELKAVEEERPALLVADLRELAFIDSSGLRLLLVAAERAAQDGRRFVVVRGSPEVDRILQITGADRQLELVSSPPDEL